MKSIKILLIIACCFICLTGCGKKEEKQNQADKTKEPESKAIIAESFEFKTNAVNFENENSVFDINVKNIAGEERYINEFLLHVKDAEGNDLAALYGYVNETIEPGGERVISCSFGNNLSNYSSLEFEVLK